MTTFVLPAPPTPSVAVSGTSDRFAVRRIFCVGRNYAAHAREMGKDPDREPPFIFMKPADTVVDSGFDVPYPPQTRNLHHEIELVVAIARGGSDIAEADSLDHVYGYGVGIDLTRRDLQAAAKDQGRPWDWGKGFDLSAPCAALSTVQSVGHLQKGRIWLAVNGTVKQDADLTELIWSVPEVIAFISQSMELKTGDLIFTGTPAGVGAVVAGDVITGGIDGLSEISINLV